jgi:hypothetical protein
MQPMLEYIRSIPRPTPDHVVTVILPEYAPENPADAMLHDQTSFWIKQQLFGEPRVILTDVPYHLGDDEDVPFGGAPLSAELEGSVSEQR